MDRACGEFGYPQFRALQVDQNPQRVAQQFFDIADLLHGLAQQVVAGVAHIDAEDVGAGPGQFLDHLFAARGGPEGGYDLNSSQASHRGRPFCPFSLVQAPTR